MWGGGLSTFVCHKGGGIGERVVLGVVGVAYGAFLRVDRVKGRTQSSST